MTFGLCAEAEEPIRCKGWQAMDLPEVLHSDLKNQRMSRTIVILQCMVALATAICDFSGQSLTSITASSFDNSCTSMYDAARTDGGCETYLTTMQ